MQTIRDKISFESIKSSALKQVGEIGDTAATSFLSTAQQAISTVIVNPILNTISNIKRLIGAAKSEINSLISRIVGDKNQILDPDRDNILDVTSKIPDVLVPDIGNIGDMKSILAGILTQASTLGSSAINQLNQMFTTIMDNKVVNNSDEDEPLTPVDVVTDVVQGMPDLNESIVTNNQGVLNAKILKQNFQLPDINTQINTYNKLEGTTVGETMFVRGKLKSLVTSGDLYQNSIDSKYIGDVSNVVGLVTLGHTIDTMSLDPEDWGASDGSTDVLRAGPANLLPLVSKYKLKRNIIEQFESSYNQLNNKMYNNLYRDRRTSNSEPQDYPIARHSDVDKYGINMATVSHTNMGDYSSIGFAKKINTSEDELNSAKDVVGVELMPLIGYLYNVNNFNTITEKPIYKVNIQGTEILVDSRGSRFLLPASRPDDTAVTI